MKRAEEKNKNRNYINKMHLTHIRVQNVKHLWYALITINLINLFIITNDTLTSFPNKIQLIIQIK